MQPKQCQREAGLHIPHLLVMLRSLLTQLLQRSQSEGNAAGPQKLRNVQKPLQQNSYRQPRAAFSSCQQDRQLQSRLGQEFVLQLQATLLQSVGGQAHAWHKIAKRLLQLRSPRNVLSRNQQRGLCHSDDELLLLQPLSLRWMRLRKVWLSFRILQVA